MIKEKELPDGWEISNLSDICEIIMGQSPPGNSYNTNSSGIPFFQGKAEFGEKYPTVKKWTTKPSKIAKPEAILMSVRAPVGDINFCDIECCIGRGLAAIKPESKIDLHYIYFYLKKIKKKIESLGTGSTFKAITGRQLNAITIIVPPLSTQKKIVGILEKAEKLREWRKEADKLTDDFLKSTFLEMFGDPILNNKNFEIKKLNNICDVRDGTHDSPKYVSEGYPLITSKNLTKGHVDFSDVNLISKEDYDAVNKRSFVDDGDIIMPMIGTIGNPIVVKKERAFAIKNVALIKFTKTDISNIYIKYLLDSNYFNYIIAKNNRGGTQKFIALGDIRNFSIPIPPIELQNKFAEVVKQVEQLRESQKQSKQHTDNLFNALMQKAFRGELAC